MCGASRTTPSTRRCRGTHRTEVRLARDLDRAERPQALPRQELPQACSSFAVRVQRDKFVPLPQVVACALLGGLLAIRRRLV